MKKELFRQFEKSLLVYRAAETAPAPSTDEDDKDAKKTPPNLGEQFTSHYESGLATLGVDLEQETGIKIDEKFKRRLDASKKLASKQIGKIEFDSTGTDTPAELEKRGKYEKQIDKLFSGMEASYLKARDQLGTSELGKLPKAKKALLVAATNFTKALELRVLKDNFRNAQPEAQANMIDRAIEKYALKDTGLSLPGLGKYIVKGNTKKGKFSEPFKKLQAKLLTLKSEKEIYGELSKLLSSPEGRDIIKAAIEELKKDLPIMIEVDKGRKVDYMIQLFELTKDEEDEKRLTEKFGSLLKNEAPAALSSRFYIRFIPGTDQPEYIEDLLISDEKFNMPQDNGRWMKHLKRECDSFATEDPEKAIEDHYKKIEDKKEKEIAALDQMVDSWPDDEDENGLEQLAEDTSLKEQLRKAASHSEKANEKIAPILTNIKALIKDAPNGQTEIEMQKLSRTLTPARIRSTLLINDLTDFRDLIKNLVQSGDYEGLRSIQKDIANDKNPMVTIKYEKMFYSSELNDRKDKPVNQYLKAYLNPEGGEADSFFPRGEKHRQLAAKPAIEEYLEEKLGITELSIGEHEGRTVLSLKKDGKARLLFVEKLDNGQLQVTDHMDEKNPKKVENSFAGLSAGIEGKTEGGKEVAEKTEDNTEVSNDEIYVSTIRELIAEGYTGKAPSRLGILIKKVKIKGKRPPKWSEANGKNVDEKQIDLDTKRAEYIIANIDEYKRALKRSPIFVAEWVKAKNEYQQAVASAENPEN